VVPQNLKNKILDLRNPIFFVGNNKKRFGSGAPESKKKILKWKMGKI